MLWLSSDQFGWHHGQQPVPLEHWSIALVKGLHVQQLHAVVVTQSVSQIDIQCVRLLDARKMLCLFPGNHGVWTTLADALGAAPDVRCLRLGFHRLCSAGGGVHTAAERITLRFWVPEQPRWLLQGICEA